MFLTCCHGVQWEKSLQHLFLMDASLSSYHMACPLTIHRLMHIAQTIDKSWPKSILIWLFGCYAISRSHIYTGRAVLKTAALNTCCVLLVINEILCEKSECNQWLLDIENFWQQSTHFSLIFLLLVDSFVEIVAWLFEWVLIDFDRLLYNNFKFVHKTWRYKVDGQFKYQSDGLFCYTLQ